jgi:hypothetical protein
MYEPGRSFVKSSSCVARVFDGETVLVPIGGAVADLGSIFVMNEVAAHVWSLIDGRMDVSGYIRAQMDRYDVGFDTAAVDIQELLGSLVQVGLVRPVPEGSHGDPNVHGV